MYMDFTDVLCRDSSMENNSKNGRSVAFIG